MGDKSKIEWTDATWNPVTGCSKVSPGCAHCYAETLALNRLAGKPGYPGLPWVPANAAENVVLRPDRLDQPLRWRKPRMVFVNSMSDLFHEEIPDKFIAEVFAVMALARRHTFQVLTKRPERMQALLADRNFFEQVDARVGVLTRIDADPGGEFSPWPLPNCWLGVSIENRRYVHRADLLRETPAAVRFISAEPLLGPLIPSAEERPLSNDHFGLDLTDIDWLVVGGESGPQHRPIHAEWVRDLLLAAQTRCPLCLNGVALEPDGWTHNCEPGYGTPRCERTAFFFKQWGGRTPKAGGRLLDGRTWDELPSTAGVPSQSPSEGADHEEERGHGG